MQNSNNLRFIRVGDYTFAADYILSVERVNKKLVIVKYVSGESCCMIFDSSEKCEDFYEEISYKLVVVNRFGI